MFLRLLDINTEDKENTVVKLRERYQYGVDIKLKESLYEEIVLLAKEIIEKTKEVIEQ